MDLTQDNLLSLPTSSEQNPTESIGKQGGYSSSCQETRHRRGWGQLSCGGQAAADQLVTEPYPALWGGGSGSHLRFPIPYSFIF